MQVFVREHCTMIAAPVQCDVDGIPKGSHCVLLKRAIGIVSLGNEDGVTLDRDHELGEVAVADDTPELLLGDLAAIDHEQDRLGGVEAAIDQVGKQGAGERRVLGAPLPEPERDLHASVVIPSATTWVRSATSMPSSIITARRTSSRRRDISSASAV